MKTKLIALTLFLFVIALHTEAFGQGWGPDSASQRLYNTATIETVTGEVSEVEYIGPKGSMRQGVHLKLKNDDEVMPVHLGPRWFMDEQDVHFTKGDKIQVKGSRINYNGKPTIIAAEVEKGEETLRLRDEDGFPMWAGWRRRNR